METQWIRWMDQDGVTHVYRHDQGDGLYDCDTGERQAIAPEPHEVFSDQEHDLRVFRDGFLCAVSEMESDTVLQWDDCQAKQRDIYGAEQNLRILWDQGYDEAICAYRMGYPNLRDMADHLDCRIPLTLAAALEEFADKSMLLEDPRAQGYEFEMQGMRGIRCSKYQFDTLDSGRARVLIIYGVQYEIGSRVVMLEDTTLVDSQSGDYAKPDDTTEEMLFMPGRAVVLEVTHANPIQITSSSSNHVIWIHSVKVVAKFRKVTTRVCLGKVVVQG